MELKLGAGNSLWLLALQVKLLEKLQKEEKKAVFENTKHYQDNWKKYSKSIF